MGRPPGHGPSYETKRQEVIAASAALFAKKSYMASTMDDIGKAAGLSRGALYYYIQSKENLLVEIQSSVLIPLLSAVRKASQADVPPLARLRLVSEVLLTCIFEKLDYIFVYESEYRHLSRRPRHAVIQQRHEFEEIVTDLLEDAINAGFFRKVDPRLAMLQFLNLHNHTTTWLAANRPWTASELSKEYCRTLFSGFTAKQDDLDSTEHAVQEFWAKNPLSSLAPDLFT